MGNNKKAYYIFVSLSSSVEVISVCNFVLEFLHSPQGFGLPGSRSAMVGEGSGVGGDGEDGGGSGDGEGSGDDGRSGDDGGSLGGGGSHVDSEDGVREEGEGRLELPDEEGNMEVHKPNAAATPMVEEDEYGKWRKEC